MRFAKRLSLIGGATLIAVAIALFTQSGRPASAGPDLSGTWSANYTLACSASLQQTGSDVTGTVECGATLTLEVEGTYNSGTRVLTLSGDFGDVPVDIVALLTADGASLEGGLSAPPIVTLGPLSGVRTGAANPADVTGLWLINVRSILAGHCLVQVEQEVNQLAATITCDNGLAGLLAGTYAPDTRQMELLGTLGALGPFEMRATISDDAATFNGIWHLISTYDAAGIMEGVRLPDKACGDANDDGRVDSIDAAVILQYGGGLLQQLENPASADVNGDRSTNSIDAQLVLQHVALLLPALTC